MADVVMYSLARPGFCDVCAGLLWEVVGEGQTSVFLLTKLSLPGAVVVMKYGKQGGGAMFTPLGEVGSVT